MVQQAGQDNASAEKSYKQALAVTKDPSSKRTNAVRILLVRAAQNIAPLANDVKALADNSDADELSALQHTLDAMLKVQPDVAALKDLRAAIADAVGKRPKN
jgi:hypothetical protein